MFLNYLKLFLLRRRHPQSSINSINIAKSVKIGLGTEIFKNVSLGNNVVLGKHTYINGPTDVGSGTIGDFCSIAGFCAIGLDSHPVDWLSSSPKLYSLIKMNRSKGYEDPKAPSVTGNDVWIGSHSVIMKGVKIGDGAVVGAVVTKDVPPYAIVSGVPAKINRCRFDEVAIAKLLQLKWWLKEDLLHKIKPIAEKKENFYKMII